MFSFPLHDVVDITNTLTQWRYFLFTSPLFNLPSFNFSPSPPSINQPSSNFLDHSTCRPGISMTYSSGLPVRSFLFSSLFTSLHFTSLLFIYPTRLLHITYISHLGQSPCTSYLIRRPTLYRRTRLSSSRQRRSHQSLGRSQHDRTTKQLWAMREAKHNSRAKQISAFNGWNNQYSSEPYVNFQYRGKSTSLITHTSFNDITYTYHQVSPRLNSGDDTEGTCIILTADPLSPFANNLTG
jgi:hypothetical protein